MSTSPPTAPVNAPQTVLVLGGTGQIGVLNIRELLVEGYKVCVYARSPQKLPSDISSNPNVTVIKGDLHDPAGIEEALKGVAAVVSSLGPSARQPSDTPLAKGYALLIDKMKAAGIRRLIALGTASIRDENDKSDPVYRMLITGVNVLAHNAYKDIVAVGETIRGSGNAIDWTIARVPLLTLAETREYQTGYVGDGKRSTTLPRVAFAAFVIDELRDPRWVHKAPIITLP